MEIGTGIAMASGIFGIVAVIYKILPAKRDHYLHCEDHSGVCQKLDGLDAWLTKIEQKLDRVIEGKNKP